MCVLKLTLCGNGTACRCSLCIGVCVCVCLCLLECALTGNVCVQYKCQVSLCVLIKNRMHVCVPVYMCAH